MRKSGQGALGREMSVPEDRNWGDHGVWVRAGRARGRLMLTDSAGACS